MYKSGSRDTTAYRSSPVCFIYFLVFHPQHNFGASFEQLTTNPSVDILLFI